MQTTTIDSTRVEREWKDVGRQLVECLQRQDFDRLAACFHPHVRCRLLTPSGLLTPVGAPAVVRYYRHWFGNAEHLKVESSQITRVGDCLHAGYRVRVREEGVWYTVEQQIYSLGEEGAIVQFDLLCSGFRPDSAAN